MAHTATAPILLLPSHNVEPEQLVVIANRRDPLSLAIAEYYSARRGIPAENLIEVALDPRSATIDRERFAAIRAEVEQRLPPAARALALAWTRPYRVECMSITAAFTFGFDPGWCSQSLCSPTARNPLFGQRQGAAGADPSVRPAMLLAATNLQDAKALIDRGIAADGTRPDGTAYLVRTSDRHRNVRAAGYDRTREALGPYFDMVIEDTDRLPAADGAMFYFTGLTRVPGLDRIGFRPGAMADHLTSFGGRLPAPEHTDEDAGEAAGRLLSGIARHAVGADDTGQMSAIEWLRAGATGSYGSVVEPCNLPGKFPHPGLAILRYLGGSTLIEAYWSSVAMPGEGVFIGDPLASPFGGYRLTSAGGWILVETRVLGRGRYRVEAADDENGPFEDTGLVVEAEGWPPHFGFPDLGRPVYRLVALPTEETE